MRPKSYRLATLVCCFVMASCQSPEKEEAHQADEQLVTQPDQDGIIFFQRPKTLQRVRQTSNSPQVIFRTSDPWMGVIGSDSPRFAVYEDSTVIFRDGESYKTVNLSESDHKKILDLVRLDDIREFGGYYDIANATDQPSTDLLIYASTEPVFISVYGSLDEPAVSSKLPKKLVSIFSKFSSFSHTQATPWLPKHIEVMIHPYEYAPEESIKWPDNWPALDDLGTKKRGEDSYSLFLPIVHLDALKLFLETQKDRGAIEISNRKWSASFRFPFPHEELWMAPNTEYRNQD
ncbi:MAG: hypothetical protein AB8B54_04460 [Sphingorhabdus sp.]